MCGCDFNQNIPKIGPKRSYDLIKEFEDIDALPIQYDIQVLEHIKCREIFSYEPSEFTEEMLNMGKNFVQDNSKQKSMERKWREGRLCLMMKHLPKPVSKPYIQMPEYFGREISQEIEIIFV
jgi:5'-3' exonuclease